MKTYHPTRTPQMLNTTKRPICGVQNCTNADPLSYPTEPRPGYLRPVYPDIRCTGDQSFGWMSLDPFLVCDTLTHGIRAVSDGSVRYNTQGSFGWVLSTQAGGRTATGMGPACMPTPTLFRAEGYALLSRLLSLHQLKEFASMHDPWI